MGEYNEKNDGSDNEDDDPNPGTHRFQYFPLLCFELFFPVKGTGNIFDHPECDVS